VSGKFFDLALMLKPIVFLLFFFAAFFVPAWPLLLLVGILYLVAWMAPKGGDSDGGGGGETPAEPHPTSPGGRWTKFTRTTRRASKPFRRALPQFK
jgi:hypothetical protein